MKNYVSVLNLILLWSWTFAQCLCCVHWSSVIASFLQLCFLVCFDLDSLVALHFVFSGLQLSESCAWVWFSYRYSVLRCSPVILISVCSCVLVPVVPVSVILFTWSPQKFPLSARYLVCVYFLCLQFFVVLLSSLVIFSPFVSKVLSCWLQPSLGLGILHFVFRVLDTARTSTALCKRVWVLNLPAGLFLDVSLSWNPLSRNNGKTFFL